MSLRSLGIDILFNAEIDKMLKVDSVVDDIKDSAIDTGGSIEELAGVSEASSRSILENFSSVGDKMQGIGKKMSIGVTAPIVAIGTGAIATVGKFDDSMAKVRAISGATGEEFDELRKTAIELGTTTAFSASESADAMTNLATAGWDTNQILAATPDMLSLASAGGLDLASAASITTNTMAQFSLEASDAGEVADIFATAAASSNTDVTNLGEAMKYAGGSAANMNMDLAQTSAVLGVFANAGIEGSSAGTTFTSMFSSLSQKAEDGAVAIGDASVAVYDANGKMRDMGSIMAEVEQATKSLTGEQRDSALQSIFGEQAMKGVNAMLAQGSDAYKELEGSIYDSEGAAAIMAGIMEDTLGGAFRSMGSALEGIMIQIGDQLKPIVQSAALFVAKLAAKFGELGDGTKKVIVFVGGLLALIGPTFLVLGKLFSVLSPIVSIFGKKAGVVSRAGKVIGSLTNPIGVAVLAIGLIVGAVVLAYNKVEWFRDSVNSAWNWIKESTALAFEWISNIVSVVFADAMGVAMSVVDRFKELWDEHGEYIMEFVQSVFETIVENIQFAMSIIQSVFEIVWPIISGVVEFTWGLIGGFVQTGIDVVTGIIDFAMNLLQGDWEGAWDAIWGIVTDIWDNIVGFFEGIDLYQIGADILSGLIEGIGSMAEAVWNKVGEIAGGIADSFKKVLKIFSPSRLFEGFGSDTMLGYTIGFEDESKNTVDTAENSANEIADAFDDDPKNEALLPKIESSNSTTRKTENNNDVSPIMNFHFNVEGVGESSIKKMAEMTKREFKAMWEEIERERKVREV